MKALLLILAIGLSGCVPALGQSDTCTVRAGKWSKWSKCQWRLLPCSEIAWPDGIPSRDTVEWRWVRERSAPSIPSKACGLGNRQGTRVEYMDCVPKHLLR